MDGVRGCGELRIAGRPVAGLLGDAGFRCHCFRYLVPLPQIRPVHANLARPVEHVNPGGITAHVEGQAAVGHGDFPTGHCVPIDPVANPAHADVLSPADGQPEAPPEEQIDAPPVTPAPGPEATI